MSSGDEGATSSLAILMLRLSTMAAILIHLPRGSSGLGSVNDSNLEPMKTGIIKRGCRRRVESMNWENETVSIDCASGVV